MNRILPIALFALSACHLNDPPPRPLPMPSDGKAAPYPTEDERSDAARRSPCGRACAHLAELHCPEANRIQDGSSCTATCDRLVKSGVSSFSPDCVVAADTQVAVRQCNVRCQVP